MPFTLISGEVHIRFPDRPRQGPEPDGDTVTFLPANPGSLAGLHRTAGLGAAFSARGMVNVRLEGIDALELHYEDTHQETAGAVSARGALLGLLGFGAVSFFRDAPYKVDTVQHHPRRAHLLARSVDRYGRVIAFLYPGDAVEPDGASIHLDSTRLERSVNAILLRRGEVYPAFYTSMPVDLREHLASLAVAARAAQSGVWPRDTATLARRALVRMLSDAESIAIWPKLFRRLAAYFLEGNTGLGGFMAWIRDGHDDRIILPNIELGNMHDVIEIGGDEIRLRFRTEQLVLVDNEIPEPAEIPSQPPVEAHGVRIVAALANPAGVETRRETVTLLNATPFDLDLTGWHLRDRSGSRQGLSGRLAAGEARRVVLHGGVRLANSGDAIELRASDGVVVDHVGFSAVDGAREGWSIVF